MEGIKNVLVPLDLSPVSVPALRVAKRIADRGGANLFIQCIAARRIFDSHEEIVNHMGREIIQRCEDSLRKMIQEVGLGENGHRSEVVSGVPFMEILSKAADISSDLIITGGLSWQTDEKYSLGQTAFKVIRVAPFHTMVLKAKEQDRDSSDIPMRKILVAVDFSEQSLRALDYALYLKTIFDSEVHVIHVLPGKEDIKTGETFVHENLKNALSSGTYDAIGRVWIQTADKPATEIIRMVKDLDIDLVAIGSHSRRRFLRNLFLGKVAYDVVRKASCSVLAVKSPDHTGLQ